MLRITASIMGDFTTVTLEGRLAGPSVEELKHFWQKIHHSSGGLLVDLPYVTFIDQEGQALLSRIWQEGADLRATGCYVRAIVEEITSSGRRASPTDISKKSSAPSRARSRRS